MPEFYCRVGTPKGDIVAKTIYADSLAHARRELERQGYWIFEVRPLRRWRDWWRLLFASGVPRVPTRTFLIFNQELATLLRAGLPLLRCLEILESRQRHPLLRFIIAGVRERVRAGASLSEAFGDFAEHVPRVYVANLMAGERSGQLETVLRRFVQYQSLIYETRRQILSALTYPAILILLASVLLGVLFTFVIPRFVSFYASMGADLPWITQLVVDIAGLVRRGLPVLVGAALGGAYLLRLGVRHLPLFERYWHRLLLRVAGIGSLLWTYAIGQLAHTLATLLSSGLPLVHALEVTAAAVWNRFIGNQVLTARNRVREGMSLHEALEAAGLRADLLLEMVQVGEQTGALDEMLEHAAHFYDEDLATQLRRLTSLIEPAILILMALVVAFVLISVYYPIFSLATAVRM
ncbi:Type II secretion system protein F [bacterium HR11]|nr:Type II secretion system protein F [bacterium HR11]